MTQLSLLLHLASLMAMSLGAELTEGQAAEVPTLNLEGKQTPNLRGKQATQLTNAVQAQGNGINGVGGPQAPLPDGAPQPGKQAKQLTDAIQAQGQGQGSGINGGNGINGVGGPQAPLPDGYAPQTNQQDVEDLNSQQFIQSIGGGTSPSPVYGISVNGIGGY